jgi:hypothetical protein
VPLPTPFPSSELPSSIKRLRSEDLRASNSETARSGFPFCELPTAPVRGDTETSSEPQDPTHSVNDPEYLI